MVDHTLQRSGHGNLGELERPVPALATDGLVHGGAIPTFHTHRIHPPPPVALVDVLEIDDATPEVLPQM